LKKFKGKKIFTFFYNLFKPAIEANLTSGRPSLLFFDLFKLYYFIKEENKF